MPASIVDLHLHSTASDGSLAPADVVALAQRNGVKIMALTDHDSLGGLPAALERAVEAGIRIIPGIELSVSEQNMDVHLLAYGFDPSDARLLEAIARYRESRHDRARKILLRLKGLGIRIPMEEVEEIARGGAIGRPHVAEALMVNGHVETFHEAFQRYLGHHAPAYVAKHTVSLEEAVEVVRDAGGVTVLAHPGTLNRDAWIAGLARRGLDGIEVWHSKHGPAEINRYREIARAHGLIMTGGSDFHGERTPDVSIGSVAVPEQVVADLDEALRARRALKAHP
ncbi:MAG TPA: PHP domain-containing protein [Candidatus Eisenbacteria bacterium]|jgi:predicted metal-dependent phosphoesterase TrpH|nr:PHP domain-containing protein [Candidatus Eisenbacteria bacterium]